MRGGDPPDHPLSDDRNLVTLVHWAATGAAVERVFAGLCPSGWRFVSAREKSPADRQHLLAEADALIVVNRDLTAADIARLDRCRIVVHQGVGTDNVDEQALRQRGIPLAVTPVGTTDEVAEFAVMLMLAVSRQLKAIVADVDARGAWPTWSYRTTSRSMAGRRIGIVGFGRIGQAVAERLLPMKAELHVFPGPSRALDPAWQGRVRHAPTIGDLCAAVEMISLHVPLRENTRHLLDAKALDRLPPGAVVVNTGRGPLIDEAELGARLADGRLAGAGLDVLVDEPPAPDHPLLRLPNVIVTPHLSSGTRDSLEAKARSIIERIAAALAPEATRTR
jgi:phosphoglycerate dehydrogenase-like enzyme